MSGRILIVDAVATNRMILRAKLSASYYDVIQADSGAEALEKSLDDHPDIILLALDLPDQNGAEICKSLKDNPKTAHIPVLILTGAFAAKDQLAALQAGADDFLTKPVNDLALFSRVRNLIRVKFMFDELRLRNATSQELGLLVVPECSPHLAEALGRVILVPPDLKVGQAWQDGLRQHLPYEFEIVMEDQVILRSTAAPVPDIYVIHIQPGKYRDGLRLVSHLRTRPGSRYGVIVLVVPEDAQAKAAKGLDLGASDYIFDPFDPLELAARLKSQMRRKQMSDQLRASFAESLRQALLDPLTGLYNRRYATQHLGKITDRAAESGRPFALMVLDIDNFKQVNDRFGHATGDRVLKEFSRRIEENLRGVDLVSRLGGEEFLVAMPDTTKAEASVAAERLRVLIEDTRFAASRDSAGLKITVSIGVALADPSCARVDQLLVQADQALYISKADGRNQVTLFSSAA